MLRELVKNGKENLEHFFEHLDIAATEKLIDEIHNCRGTLFFTGVGKSEPLAKKIAVTMTSTGTRALFMPPINALHGDIGILTDQDLVVLISKSGESEELLNLVPFIRNKGAKTISIVSDGNSKLSRACDMSISLPLSKELCPFNLVPTTSMQIQMIFGDLLTIALMRRKNFGLEQYAENHPSGKIGRRITTKVEDLMLRDDAVPTADPHSSTLNTLVELSTKRCGCVLIVNPTKQLLGIFTDGDLGRTLNEYGSDALKKPIGELMHTHPKTISKDSLAWEALKTMEKDPEHPITVLAVVDANNTLLGLIKMHDILQAGI